MLVRTDDTGTVFEIILPKDGAALGDASHLLQSDAKTGKSVVAAVLHILEEVLDDGIFLPAVTITGEAAE